MVLRGWGEVEGNVAPRLPAEVPTPARKDERKHRPPPPAPLGQAQNSRTLHGILLSRGEEWRAGQNFSYSAIFFCFSPQLLPSSRNPAVMPPRFVAQWNFLPVTPCRDAPAARTTSCLPPFIWLRSCARSALSPRATMAATFRTSPASSTSSARTKSSGTPAT